MGITQEMQDIIDAVSKIKAEKVKNKRFPTFSLINEVNVLLNGRTRQELLINAQKLQELNILRIGQTINHIYLELNDTLG